MVVWGSHGRRFQYDGFVAMVVFLGQEVEREGEEESWQMFSALDVLYLGLDGFQYLLSRHWYPVKARYRYRRATPRYMCSDWRSRNEIKIKQYLTRNFKEE